jgi:putative membrane protein
VDDEVAEFLVKSADARMMDAEEGILAAKKGSKKSIQKYGRWMVKDQGILLREIKKLAAKRSIALPTTISDKKENGREDLASKDGKEFDEEFIKMMIIDHERDIKLFENAIEFDDQEISAFAKKYLPTIQSHLEGIKAIDQSSD